MERRANPATFGSGSHQLLDDGALASVTLAYVTTTSLGFVDHAVRIDIDELYLRPGLGVHELIFSIKVHCVWLNDSEPGSYALLTMETRVSAGPQLMPLGFAPTSTFTARGWPVTEQLRILLSDAQLLAIEVARGQDGVEFMLDLTGSLLDIAPHRVPPATVQVRHRVAPARWLELLDQIGSTVAITVTVPSPLSDAAAREPGALAEPASMLQATKRLREARIALRDGDFEGCVKSCRLVLDNLKALSPPVGAEAVQRKPARNRTQEERWSALFYDLYSLTSGASHDDDLTSTFAWTRADAQAALAAIAGLLARV